MKNVNEQKKKLEQKKNRLIAETTKLRLKERKMRTRHLIEVGGLVAKAKIDHLPTNTLYGALLSLADQLNTNLDIQDHWTKIGMDKFEQEQQDTTPVIIAFDTQPAKEIRDDIRSLGLKWNKFRSEWYGSVVDMEKLKVTLKDIPHKIEILD